MRNAIVATAMLLAACGHDAPTSSPAQPDAAAVVAPDADDVRYPDPDWPTGTPESVGIDSSGMDAAATAAAGNGSYCLLVIRHGVLVGERYFNGATATSTPRSWSIAKTYTSTTVGIAIGNGDLPALSTKVSDFIPSWQGTPRDAITLEHLVTMTSGLQWSVFQDYIEMAEFAPDKSSFATGLDENDAAGSQWRYHNGGVQVIEPVFRAATGQSIEDYARAHLWSPIGETATWAHDNANHPTTYANVLATCRDHARLGYLYLHGGRWNQQQVIPASWVAAATTPSQAYNRGYGYLMWLNGQGPTIDPMGSVDQTELYPWGPADMFSARGFGGQLIDVIPSKDLVIVRFAQDPTAMTSTNPQDVATSLAEDETSDEHRAIVEPILAAIH